MVEKNGLILPYRGIWPKIADDAFIAPTAAVIGDVEVGSRSSVWFGVILRGDFAGIRVGEDTNIQDGTIVHVISRHPGTAIGSGVTIGHAAVIHACVLEDGCFVGMGAVVLDGAVVESGAMVGAGSLVPPGKRVKGGELWMGIPARRVRELTGEEREQIVRTAPNYAELAREYLEAHGGAGPTGKPKNRR